MLDKLRRNRERDQFGPETVDKKPGSQLAERAESSSGSGITATKQETKISPHLVATCPIKRRKLSTAMHCDRLKSTSLLCTCSKFSFYEKPPAASDKKGDDYVDDAPKSFLRLVKRKSRKALVAEGKIDIKKEKKITIQPGESFSDFRRRVDKEIPVRLGSMGKEERHKKKKKPKPVTKDEEDEDEEEAKRKRYQEGKG